MPDNCCDCCEEHLSETTHIQCLENNDGEEMTICQECWDDNEDEMRKEGWVPNDEPQQFCQVCGIMQPNCTQCADGKWICSGCDYESDDDDDEEEEEDEEKKMALFSDDERKRMDAFIKGITLDRDGKKDSDFICKCIVCGLRFGTAEDSCGWTQRERTFCSVTCEGKRPDWKCEEEEAEA